MRKTWTCLALGLGLVSGAPAERVRVQLGGVSVHTATAAGQVPTLEAAAGVAPPPVGLPGPGATGAGSSRPLPEVRPRALPQAGPLGPASTAMLDMDTILSHDPGPPSAEFRARMASIYAMTSAQDVEAVWFWYTLEPEDLELAERSGNAIHRWLAAFGDGESWGSEYRGPPRPPGQRGALVAQSGLQVRAEPFGARVGAFPDGAALEVLATSDSNWVQVRGGGLTGWVSGYWLRF